MNPRKAVLSSAPAKKGRVYAVDQYALWKDSRFYKRVGWSYWSHLSCTHFHEKIWPSPFTSDISIWCDAGAASWGTTMENQKLQAQGFFPPSCGMNRTADAFDCLSLAVMTCLVSKFLGKMSHSKQRERGWPGKGQSHFYLSHHLGKRISKKKLRIL